MRTLSQLLLAKVGGYSADSAEKHINYYCFYIGRSGVIPNSGLGGLGAVLHHFLSTHNRGHAHTRLNFRSAVQHTYFI